MIRRLVDFWLQKALYIAWVLLHFAYQLLFEIQDSIRWNVHLATRSLVQCLPSHSALGELAHLAKLTQTLQRTPKHLAISVINSRPLGAIPMLFRNLNLVKVVGDDRGKKRGELEEEVDLQALAKIISWAWVANIPLISLHDHEGTLKTQYRELSRYVQEELCQNLWAVKRAEEPPTLKFHNVPRTNGYMNGHSNGTNGIRPTETLHISLYSNEDGKAGIVRAAKDIFKDGLESKSSTSLPESRESSRKEINENHLNSKINDVIDLSTISKSSDVKTEPDLLVILGNVKSTLGFLPWHIRLSEIHWLPPLKKLEMRDFIKSLEKYATCHQRFGT